ncbi:MAG: ABC transporter ATP-binding protein [Candidatus Omnitrophota bacterium]|nr:ABC transporter ATP-binding protein [Candidatus Omnitrophota bacterium]
MSNILLAIKDLRKIYKTGAKEVRAVDGISIEIKTGRSIAIVGPSGAGKSTFMHMLGGLDRPTSGKVLLDGDDIYRLSDCDRAAARNRRVGFVFQFYHLLSEFTALENVMLPMMMKGQGMRERAKDILKSVGLEHRLDHLPSRLSGGESQRVAIARALANQPDLLLCDEPTGNLDSKNREAIYELLFDLKSKSGSTLVIVTHDEKLASRVDDVIRLKDGKLA